MLAVVKSLREAIVVRTAEVAEVAVVSSILREAHAWLSARDLALWSDDLLTPAALGSDVDAGRYVLAFVAGEAAGTARLTLDDPVYWPDAAEGEATYLHRLAVRRAYAGGAVSRALVDAGCQRARAAGSKLLRLDCRADVPRLRALYERLGFSLESERTVNGHESARFQRSILEVEEAPELKR